MKKPFALSSFRGKRTVMSCKTKEEATIFLEFLHSQGRKWCDGTPYLSTDNFETYGSETCYYFNEGSYGSIATAKSYHRNILYFEDFDWGDIEIAEEDEASFNDFMKNFRTYA